MWNIQFGLFELFKAFDIELTDGIYTNLSAFYHSFSFPSSSLPFLLLLFTLSSFFLWLELSLSTRSLSFFSLCLSPYVSISLSISLSSSVSLYQSVSISLSEFCLSSLCLFVCLRSCVLIQEVDLTARDWQLAKA